MQQLQIAHIIEHGWRELFNLIVRYMELPKNFTVLQRRRYLTQLILGQAKHFKLSEQPNITRQLSEVIPIQPQGLQLCKLTDLIRKRDKFIVLEVNDLQFQI